VDSRLLWGTVDMLILDVVSRGPTYGYQIAQSVLSQSKGYFELKEGSLYPALHRMERQRLLRSYWVDTDEGRRRKFYELTPAGRKALKDRRDEWQRFAAGVDGVLGASLGLA
jgi:PadR family transcriptional regulator PadR